jgi:hypothetical protein
MVETSYDLCFAWSWEYDADFATLLQEACDSRGLSLLHARPDNLGVLLNSLDNQQVNFKALFDRASDGEACFMPLVDWASQQGSFFINSHEKARCAWDKSTMHKTLTEAGLQAPATIILPSYETQPTLEAVDLGPLGGQFTIKPAHGSGGDGVVLEVTSLSQVLVSRQEYPADTYLLQAHTNTKMLAARPAWFRVIYCAGRVYPCWWDPETHVYTPVSPEEESHYGLSPLRNITDSIASITEMDFFSTEIALDWDGNFLIVDYVNDPIDLRLQSRAADGVPDEIVRGIAGHLAEIVSIKCKAPVS